MTLPELAPTRLTLATSFWCFLAQPFPTLLGYNRRHFPSLSAQLASLLRSLAHLSRILLALACLLLGQFSALPIRLSLLIPTVLRRLSALSPSMLRASLRRHLILTSRSLLLRSLLARWRLLAAALELPPTQLEIWSTPPAQRRSRPLRMSPPATR